MKPGLWRPGLRPLENSTLRRSHLIAFLVRLAGFEPAAYGLEVRCSIQLSYRRIVNKKIYHNFMFCQTKLNPFFAFFLPLKTLSVFSRPNFDIFVPLNALDIFLLFYIWCIYVISAGSCQEQDAAMEKKEGGWRDSNPRPPGPQPSALTNWATPTTFLIFLFFGTPGGIRTPGLRIRSPLLYPAELQALCELKNIP